MPAFLLHLSGQTRWSALCNACEPEGRLYSGSWAVSASHARDPLALRPAVTDGLPLSEIPHAKWPHSPGAAVTLSTHAAPTRRRRPAFYQQTSRFGLNWLFHSWRGRNILTPSTPRALLRIFERSTVLTDVLQALHDARVLVAPLTRPRGVTLVFTGCDALPPATVDEHRLGRLLSKLFTL